jgi:Ger(x)C family germination protein
MRIFWGHVKSIVYSENVLKRGVTEAYNAMNRFGEVRYNILIYGTKEKLEDIFSQKSIFNLSPLDTIMFTPEQIYSQRSSILSISGNHFIAEINEPGEPAMLPSLSIDRKVWKEDKKDKSMLQIDGAYFFHGDNMASWLSEAELAGARWTQKQLKRSLINVPAEGPPIASLVLIKPQYKVDFEIKNGEVLYNIHLKLDANLEELMEDSSIRKLENMAETVVKEEIMSSFRLGIDRKIDVLRLEETLYRNRPKLWHALHKDNQYILKRDSLKSIQVKINLINTGKYKGRMKSTAK